MLIRAFLFCLCMTLLGLSAHAFRTESAADIAVAGTMIGGLAVGVDRPLAMPLSHARRDKILLACGTALEPGLAHFLGDQHATHTYGHCADFIGRAHNRWPNAGSVALMRAALAAYDNDPARVLVELTRAQSLAKNESWQAIRRVKIVSEHLQSAPQNAPAFADVVLQDLHLLLKIQPGAEAAATTYIRSPNMRPLIAQALQRADPAEVRRFINLTKQSELG